MLHRTPDGCMKRPGCAVLGLAVSVIFQPASPQCAPHHRASSHHPRAIHSKAIHAPLSPPPSAGKLSEGERDRVEEEVGAYVRSCSSNIQKLQAMLSTSPAAASPARQRPPSPDLLAHRQGMVLILSERLGAASALFDRLRSLRYQQLQQAEAARARRLPRGGPAAPATTGELHAHLQRLRQQQEEHRQQQQQNGILRPREAPPHGSGPQQQAQTQVDRENEALQLELLGMSDQVQQAERSVREIATLNQMFSTAVLQQSEQIEKLYAQAVDATHNISAANVQLTKAVKTNRSGRKYLLAFFLIASLSLLFLDWYYS